MKNTLTSQERQRMVNLLVEAKKQGEDQIASIAQLAITMSDKGEYDKFIEIFSENNK